MQQKCPPDQSSTALYCQYGSTLRAMEEPSSGPSGSPQQLPSPPFRGPGDAEGEGHLGKAVPHSRAVEGGTKRCPHDPGLVCGAKQCDPTDEARAHGEMVAEGLAVHAYLESAHTGEGEPLSTVRVPVFTVSQSRACKWFPCGAGGSINHQHNVLPFRYFWNSREQLH